MVLESHPILCKIQNLWTHLHRYHWKNYRGVKIFEMHVHLGHVDTPTPTHPCLRPPAISDIFLVLWVVLN